MSIQVGNKVRVYHDPITVSDIEGDAIVEQIITETGEMDAKGRMIYRCFVKFGNEHERYHRAISETM